jgi:thermitase
MKKEKILIAILVPSILLCLGAFGRARPTEGLRAAPRTLPSGVYVPGQVLVKFRANVPRIQQLAMIGAVGATAFQELPTLHAFGLSLPPGLSVEEAVSFWSQVPLIEYAEPNYIVHASVTPNDSLFNKQYALSNPGGTLLLPDSPLGTQGADIKATAGWEETKGSESVVIAVLDTGVDLLHPDLKDKLFSNGRDFVNDDLDASDDNGHGTVVAGIAGAETNNSEGIAGVAWYCQILPVKVLDQDGLGTVAQVSDGITWAADQAANGVKVINVSWGLDEPSEVLRDAVEYAYSQGVLVVAAAGSTGGAVEFPAAYDNYVLAVAATDYNDSLYELSNTGSEIDVAAPGVEIMSTVPRGFYGPGSIDYGFWTGTSVAAPQVAGVAALVISLKPFLTVDEVMDVIRFSADDVNASQYPGKDEFIGFGRINFETAVVPLVIDSAPAAAEEVRR